MVFDRYLFRNLMLTTVFTAVSLAMVIMLTQSLRFLELIINSGASSFSFFTLTFLAMPRFFEVILPIALMIATVFTYNRLSADSEIVIMKSSGWSPLRLARPAIVLATFTMIVVFIVSAWLAPLALSKMQYMRVAIKAQFSTLLLREGVFNSIGNNLTVFIKDRNNNGEMEGLLIYDSRDEEQAPVTILAKRGVIVSDRDGQQVLVYDGSRQEYNRATGTLSRLDFDRYSLDLPESGPVRQRYREPDERTLYELLNPDEQAQAQPKLLREFRIEAHRRFVSPFLALTFTLISLCCLLTGPSDRRGLSKRILVAASAVIVLQGLYLVAYNLAKDSTLGLILMYLVAFAPMVFSALWLSPQGERMKVIFSNIRQKTEAASS
jgi:lipopolysaccharide export system permease protein